MSVALDLTLAAGEIVRVRSRRYYVLCLLKHQDKATLDPLDLDQWEFYVVPTAVLNERYATASGISLKGVRALGVSPVSYAALKGAIEGAVAGA